MALVFRATLLVLTLTTLLLVSHDSYAATSAPATSVSMQNVVLYPYDDAPSQIVKLRGVILPTRSGQPPFFDDVTSYKIDVKAAEVRLGAATITTLMNRYIFPTANGPVKRVEVAFGNGVLLMRGTLVKAGVPISFTATGIAQPNAAGDMTIRITDMTAAGIFSKKFMDFLGLKMSSVAQPDNPRVFRIVDNTMIIPVVSMFPPPKIIGRIRSIHVSPREMVAQLGPPVKDVRGPSREPSFIKCTGGALKFAKLTMQNVDLTLVPRNGKGPLGFSPTKYYSQMQAGFALMLPDRGLTARVPSYSDMLRGKSGRQLHR